VTPPLRELRGLLAEGQLDLPLPGEGQTVERHRSLYALGERDLSLARLGEAHTDAVAILAQAGREAARGAIYGVWASEKGAPPLELSPAGGGYTLRGMKRFCSGGTSIDRALVTARRGEVPVLVEVPLASEHVSADSADWVTPAFEGTETSTVTFDDLPLSETAVVGPPGFYLERPGFWHGALGPAACWAGGAAGLVRAAWKSPREEPHGKAHLGAIGAAAWGLRALLSEAGREIDADPEDGAGTAQARALMVRHLVERSCADVLDRFGRATGPRLLAFDASVARRHAELTLYIRQCHAERDLEALADALAQ